MNLAPKSPLMAIYNFYILTKNEFHKTAMIIGTTKWGIKCFDSGLVPWACHVAILDCDCPQSRFIISDMNVFRLCKEMSFLGKG